MGCSAFQHWSCIAFIVGAENYYRIGILPRCTAVMIAKCPVNIYNCTSHHGAGEKYSREDLVASINYGMSLTRIPAIWLTIIHRYTARHSSHFYTLRSATFTLRSKSAWADHTLRSIRRFSIINNSAFYQIWLILLSHIDWMIPLNCVRLCTSCWKPFLWRNWHVYFGPLGRQ